MNYEREFYQIESKFRPRNKFKHNDVIRKLAEVPRRADEVITDLKDQLEYNVNLNLVLLGTNILTIMGTVIYLVLS